MRQFQATNCKREDFEKGSFYTDVLEIKDLKRDLVKSTHLILSGGVGTGKTSLIKEFAQEYQYHYEKVIWLCSRTALKTQTESDLGLLNPQTEESMYEWYKEESENIKVETYQKFLFSDDMLRDDKHYLVVMDETQYGTEDSLFNEQTIKLLKFIKRHQHHCTFIMMSASGNRLFNKVIEHCKYSFFYWYHIPNNFCHIKGFYWYTSDKDIIPFIDQAIANGRKNIVFSNDTKTWNRIRTNYKDTDLVMKQSKNKPSEDEEKRLKNWCKRNDMAKYCKGHFITDEDGSYFDCPIMVATSALDVGINIKDETIENVFIDTQDWNSAYQELGRVRAIYKDEEQLVHINVFFKFPAEKRFKNEYEKAKEKAKFRQITNNFNELIQSKDADSLALMTQVFGRYEEVYHNDPKKWFMAYHDIWSHCVFDGEDIIIKKYNTLTKAKAIDEIKSNRIKLLESVIDKRLTTAEFKELAQELNFTNPKNGRLIANPKDEITELGYKVNDKKSNGSRFKVITK